MNVSERLTPVLDDLRERFHEQLEAVTTPRPDEAYIDVKMELAPGLCSYLYKKWDARLASLFADDERAASGVFYVYYVFSLDGAGFVILRVRVPADSPAITSLTDAIPAVNWQEREMQDLFGIQLIGHPNPRRCALHDDWPDVHPLRKDFDFKTELPPFVGERHKFREVEGEGVFQVPVGPVHAGIIEPGHFLFSVAGEPILYLQLRLFYVHKGTEKRFESIPIEQGVCLAESVSGDSAFAHALAYCHAVERAAGFEAPERARVLRSVCLELERIYNHISDIGAICNDVAFAVANMHAMRMRERVLRANEFLTGNRMLRGMACAGGARRDWTSEQVKALDEMLTWLEPEFESLVAIILDSSSTLERLETTGVLSPKIAKDLGIVGIGGRASGFNHDLRRDHPTDAHGGVTVKVPVYTVGDVFHRVLVRIDEVRESTRLIRQWTGQLPTGPVRIAFKAPAVGQTALGFVEGWRGEIFYWIRVEKGNRLGRCKIKDPSLQNWPAMSEAVLGNIIPDFPVINKSFNLSYSGTDR